MTLIVSNGMCGCKVENGIIEYLTALLRSTLQVFSYAERFLISGYDRTKTESKLLHVKHTSRRRKHLKNKSYWCTFVTTITTSSTGSYRMKAYSRRFISARWLHPPPPGWRHIRENREKFPALCLGDDFRIREYTPHPPDDVTFENSLM